MELLIHFIDVGLGALVKERVVNVVCVVHALPLHLLPAHVRAVVTAARDNGAYCAVSPDRVDLLGARPLRDEDLAADPRLGAVGRHGVTRVAAGILHDVLHADGLAVGDQHRCAPVLEGQRRHEIVHLEKHVLIQPDDGRHALAQGDGPPGGVIVQRHEGPVAEYIPLVPVDLTLVELGRREIQLPQPAAVTVGFPHHDRFPLSAFGTIKLHSQFFSGISAMASISTSAPW